MPTITTTKYIQLEEQWKCLFKRSKIGNYRHCIRLILTFPMSNILNYRWKSEICVGNSSVVKIYIIRPKSIDIHLLTIRLSSIDNECKCQILLIILNYTSSTFVSVKSRNTVNVLPYQEDKQEQPSPSIVQEILKAW